MPLNIRPFQYDYQPMRANPVQPIMGGDWGPKDMSKQLQEGIGNLLPELAKSYQAVNKQRQMELQGADLMAQKAQQAGAAYQQAPQQAPYGVTSTGEPITAANASPQSQKQYTFAKEIEPLFQSTAQTTGISPDYYRKVAGIESGGDIRAKNPNSSATGLFQFTDSTWKEYGAGGDRLNANDQFAAMGRLTADNQQKLRSALGRDPTEGELYLAHQQGAGGARALLSNPTGNVVDVLSEVYGGNRDRATQAVRNNGGNVNMQAGQFAQKWVGNAAASGGGYGSTVQAPPTVVSPQVVQAGDTVAPGARAASGGAPAPEVFAGEGLNIRPAYNPGQQFGRTATANAQPFSAIVEHHTGPGDLNSALATSRGDPARKGVPYGYHFLIDRDGTIHQAAPLSARTNHVMGNQQAGINNSNAIGVSLVGSGEATPEQVAAGTKLTQQLQQRYNIPIQRVVGHGEIQKNKQHTEGSPILTALRQGGAPAPAAGGGGQVSPTPAVNAPATVASASPGVVTQTPATQAATPGGQNQQPLFSTPQLQGATQAAGQQPPVIAPTPQPANPQTQLSGAPPAPAPAAISPTAPNAAPVQLPQGQMAGPGVPANVPAAPPATGLTFGDVLGVPSLSEPTKAYFGTMASRLGPETPINPRAIIADAQAPPEAKALAQSLIERPTVNPTAAPTHLPTVAAGPDGAAVAVPAQATPRQAQAAAAAEQRIGPAGLQTPPNAQPAPVAAPARADPATTGGVASRPNLPPQAQAAAAQAGIRDPGSMDALSMRMLGRAFMTGDSNVVNSTVGALNALHAQANAKEPKTATIGGKIFERNPQTGKWELALDAGHSGDDIIVPGSDKAAKAKYGLPDDGQTWKVGPDANGNLTKTPISTPKAEAPPVQGGFQYNPQTGRYDIPVGPAGQAAPAFQGNSVEAQALNSMIESGRITRQQANDLATGKSITTPDGTFFLRGSELIGVPAVGPDGKPTDQPGVRVGPAKTETLPANIAGTIGMANGFLERGLPAVRKWLDDGNLNTPAGRAGLATGRGEAGDMARTVDRGREALLRNLTGAGMSNTEAENYTRRYSLSSTDLQADVTRKLDALEQDLIDSRDAMLSGRKITDPALLGKGKGEPPKNMPKVQTDDDYEQLKSGTVFVGPDGKVRRKP